mgnify:FL=1
MNREQRRKLAKEQNRPNSKKNFADGGTVKMSLAKIQDNEDLKPCDTEVLDLFAKRMDWAEQNLVKNDYSKAIIILGCNYLDALCSLRFDITPPDDKVIIRDIMNFIGNSANLFGGMLDDDEDEDYNIRNYSVNEKITSAKEANKADIPFCIIHDSYSGWTMPDAEIVDDIYASFVAKHADELAPFLLNTHKTEVMGDEEYIMEVLQMILKKTDELLPEAQVKSNKYMMKL